MADETRREVRPELRAQRHDSRAGTTYKAFLRDLSGRGGFTEEFAESAAVSVLCTLEQRIMGQEVADMEAQLPSRLRELLQRCERHAGKPSEKFNRQEFVRRVCDDLNLPEDRAESVIRAVFTSVRNHLSEGEAEDVGGQLPSDLTDLWMRPA